MNATKDMMFAYKSLKAVKLRLDSQMRSREGMLAEEFCRLLERGDVVACAEAYEIYVLCPGACLKWGRDRGFCMNVWGDYMDRRSAELLDEGIKLLR